MTKAAVPPPPWAASVLRVGTKADLVPAAKTADRLDVVTSAVTGAGIATLLEIVTAHVMTALAPGESPLMTRERHRAALVVAAEAIADATAAGERPLELRAEDLRRAGDALGRITGRIDVEDLFDVIFRDFCIGK
jgi:tRNA modification GTPase